MFTLNWILQIWYGERGRRLLACEEQLGGGLGWRRLCEQFFLQSLWNERSNVYFVRRAMRKVLLVKCVLCNTNCVSQVRIAREGDNMCGVASQAAFPLPAWCVCSLTCILYLFFVKLCFAEEDNMCWVVSQAFCLIETLWASLSCSDKFIGKF